MKSNDGLRSAARRLFLALLLIPCAVSGAFAQQDVTPKPRDIVPVFETARPSGNGAAATAGPAGAADTVSKTKNPPFTRISSQSNSGTVSRADRSRKKRLQPIEANIAESRASQIGITLWQLTDSRPAANRETFTEVNGGRRRYLEPQRVSVDTLFQPYDLVRFAVENSRRGYLYIVDQELLRDGTLGPAYLVFPSRRINNGANLVAPGRPVELPDLNGNPFYFELRPKNPNSDELMAEVLTVIVTDRPIPGLTIGDRPLAVSEKTLDGWRARWAGRAEIFESGGRAAYTKNEREAAGGKRTLSRGDPLPQTLVLVEGNQNAGVLITVPLWYGRE